MPTPRTNGGVSVSVEIELSRQWTVHSVFGGWIALSLARVAASLLPSDRVLASASVVFARAVAPGAVTVTATLTRSGRSYGFVTCELFTPTGTAVTAQFTFVPRDRLPIAAAGADTSGPDRPSAHPPVSPRDAVAHRVDWRATSDWSTRLPGADPFVAWVRACEPLLLADAADPSCADLLDPLWYLVASDLIGPAVASPDRAAFWVATVTLDLQVLALTASPWLKQTVTARSAGPDAVGTVSLSSPSGEVVATATQRAVLTPAAAADLPYAVTAFGWGVPRESDEVPVEVHK